MVQTSGQERLRDPGWSHHLPLPPYRGHDDGVAGGDDDGGEDEERDNHQSHPHLPVPALLEVYPALLTVVLDLLQLVEEDNR